MSPPGLIFGLAIYGLIWFVVLFAILPLRVTTQEEQGEVVPGSAPSAPTNPHLGWKLLVTSLVSGAVYGCVWLAWFVWSARAAAV